MRPRQPTAGDSDAVPAIIVDGELLALPCWYWVSAALVLLRVTFASDLNGCLLLRTTEGSDPPYQAVEELGRRSGISGIAWVNERLRAA